MKSDLKIRIFNLTIIISIAIAIATFVIFMLSGNEIPGLSSIAIAVALFALVGNIYEEEKKNTDSKSRKKDKILYTVVGILSLVVGIIKIVLATK